MLSFNDYDEYNEKIEISNNFIKAQKSLNKKQIEISIDDVQINDLVLIKFYPHSQKYLYDLYPRFGYVIQFDTHYINLIYNDKIEPIQLECSSYDYSITKFI